MKRLMTMAKTAYIAARIEPKLKKSAEGVLHKLGVSTTDAITIFMQQVVIRKGLPFDVRIPNAETRAALAEIEAGGGERFDGTTKQVLGHILGKGRTRKA